MPLKFSAWNKTENICTYKITEIKTLVALFVFFTDLLIRRRYSLEYLRKFISLHQNVKISDVFFCIYLQVLYTSTEKLNVIQASVNNNNSLLGKLLLEYSRRLFSEQ